MAKKLTPAEDPVEEARREKARAYNRAYYVKNAEALKERTRIFKRENKEKVSRWCAAYRARRREKLGKQPRKKLTPEDRRERDRTYRAANAERCRENHKKWRAHNREAVKASQARYAAANRETINKKKRSAYEATMKYFDDFKSKLNGGHCNHPGCTHEWQACDVDHIYPERKGQGLSSCQSIKELEAEINRNKNPDGTQGLQLLCSIHHRMKTFKTGQIEGSRKFAVLRQWRMEQHKCANCRLTVDMLPSYCFDADHIDRSTKVGNVSQMIRDNCTIQQIKDELAKCQMLCANCHKCKTAQQMGWRWADEAFWIMGSL